MTQIQDIKERLVISQVIGESVKLTPAGTYLRGLCPFHHEKSPSFFVNDQLGYYKCFGCGEHGDVFSFVQKYENLTFPEALELLAQRAGIVLEKRHVDPQEKLRTQIMEVLQEAASYYHHQLLENAQAAGGREYLGTRKIASATNKLFNLGYAADDWQKLADHLRAQKFPQEAIVGSGLVGESKTGRPFDRFRGRLMFPLKNHRGQVVGFSGRLLKDNPNEGKYINTPETLVYHKGKMLYGLSELGGEIKKAGCLLVVEGEFDLLSSVEAKVCHVVAIKGSAFTTDQANLVARYVKKVILALDADAAGVKATRRAIEVLRPVGVEVEVLMLPAGKDPDDLARTNPAAWREQVKQTVSVYEFFLRVTLAKYDLTKITEQKKVLQELAEIFALIDNRLEYEYYLKKLAGQLGQDKEIIRQDLLSWNTLSQTTATRSAGSSLVPKTPPKQLTKLQRLEAYLWFLFLHCLSDAKLIRTASLYIEGATWDNRFLTQLTQQYQTYHRQQPNPTLAGFQKFLPQDFQEKVALLMLNQNFVKILAKADLSEEWQKQAALHQQLSHQHQVSALSLQLKELEDLPDPTLAQEKAKTDLLQQIIDLKTH